MNNYTLVEESSASPSPGFGTVLIGIGGAIALVLIVTWLFERVTRKK